MSYLYITDNGSILGILGGKFIVKKNNEIIKEIPQKRVEAVYIIGNSMITTPCMQYLLVNNIPTCFFSIRGKYYGRLQSVFSNNIELEQLQTKCFKNDKFSIELSKSIIDAKINNQITIINRYNKDNDCVNENELQMKKMRRKVEQSKLISELRGYEGIAAKLYFKSIGEIIKKEYKFYNRSKRPPKDPFNSMISFGYTIISNEIFSVLQNLKLNPYCGFMHKSRNKFPALVADLIEEWRAILIDSTVLAMINGGEVKLDDFMVNVNDGSIFLSNNLIKKYINKIENKLNKQIKYLKYTNKEYTYRECFYIQSNKIKECIRENRFDLYKPILIR